MNIKKSIKEISKWGVEGAQETYLQKKIILTNEICLLAGTGVILSSFFLLLQYNPVIFLTNLFLIAVVVLTLLLNKFGHVHFSRFLISFLPLSFLLLSSYFNKQAPAVDYLVFSFAIIGLNLVPLLIFNYLDEKVRFIIALAFNFIFLLFYDRVLILMESGYTMPEALSDHYFYFKAMQVQLWTFIVISVMFVKRVNKKFERNLEALNRELKETNHEILTQNEEIAASNEEIAANNEELTQQQEQIIDQRNYIESQNAELKNYQNKLLSYIYELSTTNDKLAKKEAENKSILNALRVNFMMIEFDLNANVSWITSKTCEYLGLGKSKILGKNAKDIVRVIPENGRDYSFDMFWEKVLAGESVNADFELKLPKKDLFISTTLAPIMDENGDPVKVLAIAEDISSIIIQQKVIESKNILLETQQGEIKDRNEELRQQKEEIEAINENLELRVKERTNVLEQKNKQLAEYAFINAHLLRAPVSTILGLINLMGHEKLSSQELELYKYLKDSANQLDKIVFKINRAIEMNKEFDREFLRE